jgi:hypothetical protein
LRATYRARLSITTSASAAASWRQFWRNKHDMPNGLVGRRFGSTRFHAGCQRGLDHSRQEEERHVQRCRRCQLRQRTESPIR